MKLIHIFEGGAAVGGWSAYRFLYEALMKQLEPAFNGKISFHPIGSTIDLEAGAKDPVGDIDIMVTPKDMDREETVEYIRGVMSKISGEHYNIPRPTMGHVYTFPFKIKDIVMKYGTRDQKEQWLEDKKQRGDDIDYIQIDFMYEEPDAYQWAKLFYHRPQQEYPYKGKVKNILIQMLSKHTPHTKYQPETEHFMLDGQQFRILRKYQADHRGLTSVDTKVFKQDGKPTSSKKIVAAAKSKHPDMFKPMAVTRPDYIIKELFGNAKLKPSVLQTTDGLIEAIKKNLPTETASTIFQEAAEVLVRNKVPVEGLPLELKAALRDIGHIE